jgi:hypothetical protein
MLRKPSSLSSGLRQGRLSGTLGEMFFILFILWGILSISGIDGANNKRPHTPPNWGEDIAFLKNKRKGWCCPVGTLLPSGQLGVGIETIRKALTGSVT